MIDRADHLAAGGFDEYRRIALQGMAEGIIRRDEEPVLAAGFRDRLASDLRQSISIVVEMEALRRAGLAGEIGRAGAGNDENLALLPDDIQNRKAGRGCRTIGDHVNAALLDPAARDGCGNIGLVLM